jgi:nitrogen regulatory protein PII
LSRIAIGVRGKKRGGETVKYIIAVIKPQKLEDVRKALTGLGVEGMTVTEVKGFGRQKGHSEVYRGAEYQVDFMPKLKLEIAIEASRVASAVEAIRTSAKTDRIGDGKIFVLNLEEAVRVRTGESGAAAL